MQQPETLVHGAHVQLADPEGRWNRASRRVRCSQLHGPATVLLGDAGHAVTPDSGQGFNAGLEDVSIMTQLLDQVRHSSQRMQPYIV